MTDDSKEWVTIKIPKAERDDARDDPRTYGEIIRDGLDVGEIPDGGPEAITDALTDDEVAIIGTQGAIVDRIAEQISGGGSVDSEQLDRIESSTATVEERTGQIQRDLEDLGR